MKVQGQFKYIVNGENKTKEEIDNMDLSNMDCTVENLTVSYSFSPEKTHVDGLIKRTDLTEECKMYSDVEQCRRLENLAKELTLNKEFIQYFVNVKPSPEKIQAIRSKMSIEKLKNEALRSNTDLNILSKIVSAESEDELNGILNIGNTKETIRTKTDDLLDEVDKYQKSENGGVLKGGEFPYDFIEDFIMSQKDDVITNNSRGEKEMLSYMSGVKDTENKVDYGELDWDYIDSIANRMSSNTKYAPENWKKPLNIKELAKSAIRHARKILQEIEGDEESLQEHCSALGANGMMINYQIKLQKDLEKSK